MISFYHIPMVSEHLPVYHAAIHKKELGGGGISDIKIQVTLLGMMKDDLEKVRNAKTFSISTKKK